MHAYISTNALPKLCMPFHLKMTGPSSTDDARVKVPSFEKGHICFLQYEIFHRDAIHLYFVCMKMFLTAVIKRKLHIYRQKFISMLLALDQK